MISSSYKLIKNLIKYFRITTEFQLNIILYIFAFSKFLCTLVMYIGKFHSIES